MLALRLLLDISSVCEGKVGISYSWSSLTTSSSQLPPLSQFSSINSEINPVDDLSTEWYFSPIGYDGWSLA